MNTSLRNSVLAALLLVSAHSVQAQGILTPEGAVRLNVDAANRIGSTDRDLTFTPVTPCRIIDTRVAGGPIAANSTRNFLAVAVSPGAGFAFQGGSSTDCGVAAVNASAVAINVTAVTPAGPGYATIYQAGVTRPLAASINYAAGAIVNNTVVVSIPNPLAISDFTVYTFAASDYVVDIVGYYSLPEATQPTCVATAPNSVSIANGVNTYFLAPACPSGYQTTMAYCWANGVSGVYSTGSGLNGSQPSLQAFCGWQNNSGAAATVANAAICCRVPGK